MRKTVRIWFLVDILCVTLFALGVLLFATVGKPYERGFFCNDESIKKPYKDSTIPTSMAIAVAAVLSVIIITLNELFLNRKKEGYYSNVNAQPYKCFSFNIPKVVTTIIWFIYADVFGTALNVFITDVGKYSLGRLRPHFLDVCKPAWNAFNCTDETGRNIFITADVCTAAASKITKDMRLSFPSGHASFSAYTMIFLVLYIESRVHLPKDSKFLKLLMQAVLVLLALYTGFTRVSDYKHHWSDVLAGLLIGTTIAVIIVIKVLGLNLFQVKREEEFVVCELSEPASGMLQDSKDIEAN